MESGVTLLFVLSQLLMISFAQIERLEDNMATYSVVAPKKLRPNLDYHVSATVHNVPSPVHMTISIEGPADNGNYNSISKVADLNPSETQILKFEVGEWSSGNYSLTVSGDGGLTFQNQTTLIYEPKSYSVFIQTDKAIYKPGQLVQFRIIVVNLYLLPSVTGAIDIYITDANENRIKQWNRIFTSKGILSFNLLLSDKPVLGDWTIHVEILGQSFMKTFTVAEYVLPTFSVEIITPSYATFNKSDIVATVQAKYTYGKPVKGEVIFTAAPNTQYSYYPDKTFSSFETTLKIDGSVNIPMNLVQDLQLKPNYYYREIIFNAVVQEELTGRKYNASSLLKMHETDIKIELIKSSKTFKPGLKYVAFLKVAHQDDKPLTEDNAELILKHGYTYNDEKWSASVYKIPKNGLVKLEFYPPHKIDNASVKVLNIQAEFHNHTYYISNIDAAISPSDNFIQATLLTQNPKIDEEAILEVNATEPLNHVVVEVIGRGGIAFANTFKIPNEKNYQIRFPISHRMTPRAHVVIYYIRNNNSEVIADAVNFEVPGVLRTPITVKSNIDNTKPGAEVNIEVETKPNAFIGLLGIDESILLLKSGNDITEKDVIDEIDKYFPGADRFTSPWYRRRKRSFWWPGLKTAGEIFDESGLIILTNGLVPVYIEMIMYRMNSEVAYTSGGGDMMYDDSFNSKSSSAIKVRKQFPETWLWNDTMANSEGKFVLSSQIPDTITSWIVSAFSMDSVTGLGIAPQPAKITTFRPFFVKLNLPYSIIRGESIAIQVIVFNYNNKAVEAKVSLSNEKNEFDFTIAGNEITDETKMKTKTVTVPAQDGVSVSFLITPQVLGYIDIKVTAVSSLAGDAVLRTLLVKPEGATQYFNKAVLIDLRAVSSKPLSTDVAIDIPSNAVEGSQSITVSAIGDLLGPSVNNLDQLLQMPFGCGEQNMLNFVPNIVITEYLQRADRLTPEIQNKSRRYMETGYQRELTYMRDDGSFSAFGKRDKSGSTWLTAFVVRSFHQAIPYIDIDDKVIEGSLKWLIQRQNLNGSFDEPGEVHHKAMQGGAGSGTTLTAFVLIALLENQAQKKYPQEVKLTEKYIVKELANSEDPYMVSIATYALHLSDNPKKEFAFQKLQSLAKQKGDYKYWSKEKSEKEKQDNFLSLSEDIEMTAYALLTYALRADVVAALPIMRWLISQQNENGGYSSTQDTVVGIQALGKMAARLVSSTVSINTEISFGNNQRKTLNITRENALVLQRIQIPSTTKMINLKASGFGVGIVQVSWSYNLAVEKEKSPFSLKPTIGKSSTENFLELNVCTNYKEEGATNMAVMEIVLPTGYAADVDSFPAIHKIPKVKQVDSVNGDSKVIVYFDRIDKEEMCVVLPAYKNYKVANQKPVPVEVYDYYNLAKSSRMFYQVQEGKLCDICENEDCGKKCNSIYDSSDNAGFTFNPSPLLIIFVKIYLLIRE
ncbi:CD109 antigen [Centruroides vittatus]|uniref:CD109 antigen n=1 Tax=Centruroides vittatus TaxID=120091 RepID=UPI00350EFF2F